MNRAAGDITVRFSGNAILALVENITTAFTAVIADWRFHGCSVTQTVIEADMLRRLFRTAVGLAYRVSGADFGE